MRALIQRCKGTTRIRSVTADKSAADSFEGVGLVVLLGWLQSDGGDEAKLLQREEWIRNRVQGLRVFPDQQGKLNLSLVDYLTENPLQTGGILWVSQFTLAAELESGFRPSFSKAMEPTAARARFEGFVKRVQAESTPYKNIFGIFGADMDLEFCNWGPVTIPLER